MLRFLITGVVFVITLIVFVAFVFLLAGALFGWVKYGFWFSVQCFIGCSITMALVLWGGDYDV